MKFTFSWLKEYLDTTASVEEVAARLTWLGLEVENLSNPGVTLAPFIVARVVSAEKHPNADRLKLCVVDTGKEKLQVACGAPNARAGLKGVFARPGTLIPVSGEKLKVSSIRGVESNGMLCSARELLLGEDSSGIIELPEDAPVGESFAAYRGLNDAVFELKLTPNRSDAFGVYGIARDLAASGMGKLKPRKIPPAKARGNSPLGVSLDFDANNKAACPYFIGCFIKGVSSGPSPEWLQNKLRAIGLRPISALVDITNYLTFDSARPLHVFDAAKVKGGIHVRLAKRGEKILALNGKEYALDETMTVIADDMKALAIAGIIGGMESGCTETTTDVFVECAYFDPIRTARTGRKLQIISDARTRFERGVDPAFMKDGAELTTALILEACGGEASNLVIAGSAPEISRSIHLRASRCASLGGLDVPAVEQEKLLRAIGCEVKKKGDGFEVQTPSWRPDMEGEEDCVEEILRLKGYEAIPAISLPIPRHPHESGDPILLRQDGFPLSRECLNGGYNTQQKRREAARRALASRGLLESVTWSFTSSKVGEAFSAAPQIKIQNPISSDLDALRQSVLANLLQAAKRNADRGFPDVGVFEIGPVYNSGAIRSVPAAGASGTTARAQEDQALVATGLRAGLVTPRHWSGPARDADLYDAKADALAALEAAGIHAAGIQAAPAARSWYHPGRSGVLKQGNLLLAEFGEIHPGVLLKLDMKGPAVGFEVFLDALPALKTTGAQKPLADLSDLQPVRRDFAFVLDAHVEAEKLVKAVKLAARDLIDEVSVFDVYEGEKLGAGKKSLALEVRLQPRDKTLTEAEIEAVSAKITAAAEKATGAVLRK